MEFGVHFVNSTYPEPDRAVEFCLAAERVGFSFAVTIEHVVMPTDYTSTYPYSPTGRLPGDLTVSLPDPLVWMTHMAARTERLPTNTLDRSPSKTGVILFRRRLRS